jgi:hypothetical protein
MSRRRGSARARRISKTIGASKARRHARNPFWIPIGDFGRDCHFADLGKSFDERIWTANCAETIDIDLGILLRSLQHYKASSFNYFDT